MYQYTPTEGQEAVMNVSRYEYVTTRLIDLGSNFYFNIKYILCLHKIYI